MLQVLEDFFFGSIGGEFWLQTTECNRGRKWFFDATVTNMLTTMLCVHYKSERKSECCMANERFCRQSNLM